MAKRIALTWTQVFPKGAYLAGIRPYYNYVNGQKSDVQTGWYYNIVNRDGYEIIPVKVIEKNPLMTQQEIDDSLEDIPVVAEGFIGSIYDKDGKIKISGTAEKVVLK